MVALSPWKREIGLCNLSSAERNSTPSTSSKRSNFSWTGKARGRSLCGVRPSRTRVEAILGILPVLQHRLLVVVVLNSRHGRRVLSLCGRPNREEIRSGLHRIVLDLRSPSTINVASLRRGARISGDVGTRQIHPGRECFH